MEHLSLPEFLFSCEHAGNKIPEGFDSLFDGADDIVNSHRGWDIGVLELAKILANDSEVELISYPYTRLLIDPNRSIGHPKLFSEFTRHLLKENKQEIIDKYYLPYRNRVIDLVRKNVSNGISTIHISVHSFTPVLDKNTRNFEIGLLYDPKRAFEKKFCLTWKTNLEHIFPGYRVRMNQPYRGVSDGFTTFLRKFFDENMYLGIELEVNQDLLISDPINLRKICHRMVLALQQSNQD